MYIIRSHRREERGSKMYNISNGSNKRGKEREERRTEWKNPLFRIWMNSGKYSKREGEWMNSLPRWIACWKTKGKRDQGKNRDAGRETWRKENRPMKRQREEMRQVVPAGDDDYDGWTLNAFYEREEKKEAFLLLSRFFPSLSSKGIEEERGPPTFILSFLFPYSQWQGISLLSPWG